MMHVHEYTTCYAQSVSGQRYVIYCNINPKGQMLSDRYEILGPTRGMSQAPSSIFILNFNGLAIRVSNFILQPIHQYEKSAANVGFGINGSHLREWFGIDVLTYRNGMIVFKDSLERCVYLVSMFQKSQISVLRVETGTLFTSRMSKLYFKQADSYE